MTTEPVILPPDATVAEALARVRAARAVPRPGRPGLRLPAADGDPDRPVHRHRPHPAAAARAALRAGQRRRRHHASSRCARTCTLAEVTHYLATYNLVAVPDRRRERPPARRRHRRRRPRPPAARGLARPGSRRAGDQRRSARQVPRWRVSGVTTARVSTSRARCAGRWCRPRPYDPEAFGRLSERIARFIGTGPLPGLHDGVRRRLADLERARRRAPAFDPYPFIFLTLILSLQASYAAPLILLAQNRQADRDRVQYEQDRGAGRAQHRGHRLPHPRARRTAHRRRRRRHPRLPALGAAPPARGPRGPPERDRGRAPLSQAGWPTGCSAPSRAAGTTAPLSSRRAQISASASTCSSSSRSMA